MTADHTSLCDVADPWLKEEYPTIWALAVTYGENERIGRKSSQLEAEAEAVMYELWLARKNARDA
jgi:hypothetical protein